MNNNKYKILLVEDEKNIRSLVKTMLESAGYQVIEANTCQSAQTLYQSYIPDLIILDLGLPDRDGRHLLRFVREQSITPIIVLSARTEEKDKVDALDMGANDYVTKPFGSAELLARVRSALRNTRGLQMTAESRQQLTIRGLVIDYESRQVFLDGQEVRLTQTEYNIVAFLSEHCGKMMTYSAIIKAIWGDIPNEGNRKKLQVNMANIRKKFHEKPGVAGYISNELGVGYRMNGDL